MNNSGLILFLLASSVSVSRQDIFDFWPFKTEPVIVETVIDEITAFSSSAAAYLEYKNYDLITLVEIGLNDTVRHTFRTPNLPYKCFIKDLEPCTQYKLFIRTHSTEKTQTETKSDFTTDIGKISSVEGLKYDSTTELLNWLTPSFGAKCIQAYAVYDGQNQTVTYDKSIKLIHLSGCSNYTIQIAAIGFDKSYGEIVAINIEVGFKEPGRILKIVAEESVSPYSVTFSWEQPQRNVKCVEYYAVLYDKQETRSSSNSLKINDLEPCKKYNFRICPIMKNNFTGHCAEHMLHTKYATPEIRKSNMILKSFSVNVTLEYRNENCIKQIQIELTNGVNTRIEKRNLSQFYHIDELKPCTKYNMSIRGSTNDFGIPMETFKTKSVALNASVENIRFDKETRLVTWQPPTFGAECITGYSIKHDEITVKRVVEWFTLTRGGGGCSNFSVEIIPMGMSESKGKSKTKVFQNRLEDPNGVEIINAVPISQHQIKLIWNMPTMNPDCVKKYAVYCNKLIEYTNLTTYTINNLEPCTDYNITVCVVMINNQIGNCTNFKENIRTHAAVPTIVKGEIISQSFSANMLFEFTNAKCIKNIKIKLSDGRSELFDQSHLTNRFIVDNLKPCTKYSLIVNVNSEIPEIISYTKMFTTQSVTITAVENVEFDQNTGILIWRRPSNGSECIQNYIIDDGLDTKITLQESYDLSYIPGCLNLTVAITPVGHDGHKGIEHKEYLQTGLKDPGIVDKLTVESENPNSITVTYNIPSLNQKCIKTIAIMFNGRVGYTNLSTYIVNNLEACTVYSIQLCIIKINNETGLCTDAQQNITTKSDRPDTIINEIITGATFVNVSLGYKNVKCIKNIEIGLFYGHSASYETILPEYYVIERLNPCTAYNFLVETYSDFSKISSTRIFQTESVQINAVENVTFDQVRDEITWNRPEYGSSCIKHYEIYVGGKTFITNSELFETHYLPGCSKILIQITPVQKNGVQGDSISGSIETGIKDPDIVKIIFAESYSPFSINVSWYSPMSNPLCVQNYAVVYNTLIQYTNLTNYTINHLEPCTEYNLQICIVMRNNKMDLCTEYSSNISTLSVTPDVLIDLTNLDSSSATFSLAYKNVNCIWYFQIGIGDIVLEKYDKSNFPKLYHIDKLTSCSEYTLFIEMYHKGDLNDPIYMNRTFITKSINISGVENIEFNDRNGLLTWMQPNFGRDCVKRYSIVYNNITNITSTESFNLSNLPGCSKYSIEITPEADNNVKGESRIKIIQTEFKSPNSVSNVDAFSNNPSSIHLTWASPSRNPNCVRNYDIKYDKIVEHTNLTQHTIHNLEPCVEYSIDICIVMINNQTGLCTNKTITTSTGIPGKVQNLRYTNSIVEWAAPSYGSKCIANYILAVYDPDKTQIGLQEVNNLKAEIRVGLLKSCEHYTVSVTPNNVDNVSGMEEIATFQTEPIKPTPPSAPKLISRTATTLDLESYYENEYDLCPLWTATFRCRANRDHQVEVFLSQNQRKFNVAIHRLMDLTNYTCTAFIMNSNFSSEESSESVFETDEKLADPPNLIVSSIKSKSLNVSWQAPAIYKVRLKHYHIRIRKIGKNFAVPKECTASAYNETFVVDAGALRYEFQNLEPYTNYSVQIAIENTAGIGAYSDSIEIVTEPDVSHQVTNFHIYRITLDQVELKWDLPCEINGEIASIKGQFFETKFVNSTPIQFEWQLKPAVGLLFANSYLETRIKPEHFYNTTIGIELRNFSGPLNETAISFKSPAGIPAAYASGNWGFISQKSHPINNVKLIVKKDLFRSTKGKIRKFTFLISERHCQEEPRPNYMFFINDIQSASLLPTWFTAVNDKCTPQYQIEEFNTESKCYEVKDFEFTIGNETCVKVNEGFCNGPLKSGTDYSVFARVYTSIGFADTNPIYFTTESDFPSLIVLFTCFVIFGILAGLGIIRFKSNFIKQAEVIVHAKNDSVVKSTRSYQNYLNIDWNVVIDEYDSINALNLSDLTSEAAQKHKSKNRYINILPYDHNRVYLSPNIHSPTDYINASYIDGYTRPDEYIAGQGPILETCFDFWNMIVETGCHEIVMLAKLIENGRSKCAQYYPNRNAVLEFNDISIINIRENDLEQYTRRELKITKGLTERLVVQYHFQIWPDHGCPENELDLINFIQFIRLAHRENSASLATPIVVHCSAGVGRTGTLIALDILMQQLENDKDLNVCETVKNLRCQRVKMVQTLEQYQFIYKCVARYIRLQHRLFY